MAASAAITDKDGKAKADELNKAVLADLKVGVVRMSLRLGRG